MKDLAELMEFMTRPQPRLVEDISKIEGDIMILGAGGKVGPSLAIMAKRACEKAGISKRVIAVSIFDRPETRELMLAHGVELIEADLFDSSHLSALPDCKSIIYMMGRKFGTTDSQSMTWAVNVLLPAKICERFPDSDIVVFSTGNVYGDVPVLGGGSVETDEPNPDGEYGQTCLGRERVFEHYAAKDGTRSLLFRLNYAIELRYGVLFDIANAVYSGRPVSLGRGIYNCLWQGDVCEYAIRSLLHTSNPPAILNVTGPQCVSTRWTANEFARIFGKEALFDGQERPEGLYSNTTRLNSLMGMPHVSLGDMISWQADWIKLGGETIAAPTHFEQVDGKY